MKILQSISKIYRDQYPLMERLKKQVDLIFQAKKKESWHYLSRIKNEESFALKLETGRVYDPFQMEDFFAATLVVENIAEISKAIDFVQSFFDIQSRRPKDDGVTHKRPSSFEFDDLRLYLKLKKVEYLPAGPVYDWQFELQIKTFLQHAWGIATHDLIYKSDTVSWATARVAFQVKAMLEQAEISISGANELSRLPELNKTNHEMRGWSEAKDLLTAEFPPEALPADLLRMSQTVVEMCKKFDITLVELKAILATETAAGRGTKTLDLSPYAILLQGILNHQPMKATKMLASTSSKQQKILLPQEVNVAAGIVNSDRNIIKTSRV